MATILQAYLHRNGAALPAEVKPGLHFQENGGNLTGVFVGTSDGAYLPYKPVPEGGLSLDDLGEDIQELLTADETDPTGISNMKNVNGGRQAMPELGNTYALADLALAKGIGRKDPIVEMLSKSTPLIEDMAFRNGNG